MTNDDLRALNLNDLIVSDTLYLDIIESKPYLKNMDRGSLNCTESSFQPILLSNLNETQALGLRGNYTNYGFEGARSVGFYFKSDIGDKISLMVNPYVASYFSGPHNLSPVMASAIQLNLNY
ncbi:hypothetical protein AwDysgo_02580 [Bacteroidales bacterium]|nr:hypothetical protein AwDysgo_02580 [Bacteroidales bacterium]